MNKLFLPVRSNAGWFESETTRQALEKSMKQLLLFYDRFVLEDARYLYTCLERGAVDLHIPRRYLGTLSDRVQYSMRGHPFEARLGPVGESRRDVILEGEIVESYEIDFYPIIRDAGLLEADYLEWVEVGLTPAFKGAAEEAARRASQDSTLTSGLSGNNFKKAHVLKALHIDQSLAFGLKLPFFVSWEAREVIRRIQETTPVMVSPTPEGVLSDVWISLALPDFGFEPWDRLHDIRSSRLGQDFRAMVARVVSGAQEAYKATGRVEDLRQEVLSRFVQELVTEISRRRTTGGEVLLNMGLYFIPGASNVMDLSRWIDERSSWVSLLVPRDPGSVAS